MVILASKAYKFRWVRNADGKRLDDVGINADGSLHNPNGYPDEAVRNAVEAALARWRAKRRAAAAKAAITRKRRRDSMIYHMAQTIVEGRVYGPRNHCFICRRGLGDVDSIERGIGSECWESVLKMIEARYDGEKDIEDPGSATACSAIGLQR